MIAAVIGAIAVIPIWFSGFGDTFSNLDRDVAIQGPTVVDAPGEISFRVTEPLSGPEEMRVGIGVPWTATAASCWFEDNEGNQLPASRSQFDTFVNTSSDFEVQVVAQLAPGDYRAVCDQIELDATSTDRAVFSVGRVFGEEFVEEFFSGFAGVGVVFLIATVVFIVGLVLLVIGLVRRSSARRPPPMPPGYGAPPPGGPGWGPPTGPPPSHWPDTNPPPPGSGWSPPSSPGQGGTPPTT